MKNADPGDRAAKLALDAAYNLVSALRQKSTQKAIGMLKQSGRQIHRAVTLLEGGLSHAEHVSAAAAKRAASRRAS